MNIEAKNRKVVIADSKFNRSIFPEIIGVEVEVAEERGECDCFYEELDPDSYHKTGCSSLYLKVRLSTGEIKTMRSYDVRDVK